MITIVAMVAVVLVLAINALIEEFRSNDEDRRLS